MWTGKHSNTLPALHAHLASTGPSVLLHASMAAHSRLAASQPPLPSWTSILVLKCWDLCSQGFEISWFQRYGYPSGGQDIFASMWKFPAKLSREAGLTLTQLRMSTAKLLQNNMADVEEVSTAASEETCQNRWRKTSHKNWKWTDDKVFLLIEWIMEYKVKCEFNNIDFNSNLVQMYIEILSKLAKSYLGDFNLENEWMDEQTNERANERTNE